MHFLWNINWTEADTQTKYLLRQTVVRVNQREPTKTCKEARSATPVLGATTAQWVPMRVLMRNTFVQRGHSALGDRSMAENTFVLQVGRS